MQGDCMSNYSYYKIWGSWRKCTRGEWLCCIRY